MKYYIRLMKKRRIVLVFVCLIASVICIGLLSSIIKDSLLAGILSNGAIGTVTVYKGYVFGSNIAYFILFLFNLYIFGVFIPVVSPDAQEPSEYRVNFDQDTLRIQFQKYSWTLQRNKFSSGASLMFFDDEHHFVSMLRGYQVYNYVHSKVNISFYDEKDLSCLSQIKDAILMNDVEKVSLIKEKHLNKKRYFLKFWGIWFIICGVSVLANMKSSIQVTGVWQIIGAYVFMVVLGMGFLIAGILTYYCSNDGVREAKRIKEATVYMKQVNCYEKTGETDTYVIKVTDGDLYLNQKFEISKADYEQAEQIRWKLYFYINEFQGYSAYIGK